MTTAAVVIVVNIAYTVYTGQANETCSGVSEEEGLSQRKEGEADKVFVSGSPVQT